MPRTETKFAVRCTEDEKRAIEAQAARHGMSVAAFVRHAVARSEADVRAAEDFVCAALRLWSTADGGYGRAIHPTNEPFLAAAVSEVGAEVDGLTVFHRTLEEAVRLEGLLEQSRLHAAGEDGDTQWAAAHSGDRDCVRIIDFEANLPRGWIMALGPFDSAEACREALRADGWREPGARGSWWRAPAPLAMPEALQRLRRSYAADIRAGRVTVEPSAEGAGDCIVVEGPGVRGAVLYSVPLEWDDTGHWSTE